MTSIFSCLNCKHYKKEDNTSSCTAFPERIPRKIYSKEILHFNKMKSQVGDFIFEPIKYIDSYKKYFKLIKKMVSKRVQIEKEAVELTKEIIENLNAKNITKFIRGEIRINRSDSITMNKKTDEILFFDSEGKPELISIGFDSELFKKLESILLIECVENHKTDLEFIINYNSNYEIKFLNLNNKERSIQNATISLIHDQRTKDRLIQKGLLAISSEQLKTELKIIIKEKNKVDLPRDKDIVLILRNKGFAVLDNEVTKSRREIGFKSKKELRIERIKEREKHL